MPWHHFDDSVIASICKIVKDAENKGQQQQAEREAREEAERQKLGLKVLQQDARGFCCNTSADFFGLKHSLVMIASMPNVTEYVCALPWTCF